jgi:hypothetical protein
VYESRLLPIRERSVLNLLHPATKAARKAFYEAYSWFVGAFRDAAEKLRRGDRGATFPAGSSRYRGDPFPKGLWHLFWKNRQGKPVELSFD